jgi:hypothetical protein
MIDNKKINKAAKHYAKENSMYIEDQMGDVYNCIEELSDAYKAGAKWAINKFFKDLWHDAEEEPYTNLSPILFDGRDREGRQIVKTNFFRSSYWNKTVEYYGIVRWFYLEDVLLNEEDK